MNATDTTPPGHRFAIPVRYADTDAQSHVFFGNYFTYMDEAYMGYLEAIGFSWAALADRRLETYYVSARCQFLGPAYYGDTLLVYTECSRLGNSSLDVEMTVIKAATGDVVAKGALTAVMIDSTAHKPVRIPDDFRQAVERVRPTA